MNPHQTPDLCPSPVGQRPGHTPAAGRPSVRPVAGNNPRRNRRSARQAGTRFERQVADYLAAQLDDDRIDRRARNGNRDRGDITGLRHMGQRVVIECKDTTRWTLAAWLTEVETERGNDDASAGLVVAKRRGKGDPGDAVVLLTLRDLCHLLTGSRP